MTNKELIEKLRWEQRLLGEVVRRVNRDEVFDLLDRLEAADAEIDRMRGEIGAMQETAGAMSRKDRAEIDRLKGLIRWMHKQMNFVWDGDAFTIFTGLEDCPEKTEIEKIVGES